MIKKAYPNNATWENSPVRSLAFHSLNWAFLLYWGFSIYWMYLVFAGEPFRFTVFFESYLVSQGVQVYPLGENAIFYPVRLFYSYLIDLAFIAILGHLLYVLIQAVSRMLQIGIADYLEERKTINAQIDRCLRKAKLKEKRRSVEEAQSSGKVLLGIALGIFIGFIIS